MLKIKYLVLFLFIVLNAKTQGFDPFGSSDNKVENDTEGKFLEAKKLLYIGKNDEAIKLLDQLLLEDKKNPTLLFEIAKAYQAKNDEINTDKYLDLALSSDPKNTWILHYALERYMAKQKYVQAIPLASQLHELNAPRNLYYLDLLIEAARKSGNINNADQSIRDLELKLGPTTLVLQKYATLYKGNNDTKYETVLKQLTILHPTDKIYLKELAGLYSLRGDKENAKAVYSKVLELDPNDTDANVATLMSTKNKTEGTNAYLRTLMPIVKNNTIPIDQKVKELIPYLKQFVEKNDTALGSSLKELGNALSLAHPQEAKSFAFLADVYVGLNQYNEAINFYERALGLNDKNYMVWEQLMDAQEITENYAKLLTTASNAIDLFPNQVEAYVHLSNAYYANKKYKDGLSIADEAIMIAAANKPLVSMAKTAKAQNLLGLNKIDEGLLIIEEAILDSNRKNPLAYKVKAALQNAKGLQKEAAITLEELFKLGKQQ